LQTNLVLTIATLKAICSLLNRQQCPPLTEQQAMVIPQQHQASAATWLLQLMQLIMVMLWFVAGKLRTWTYIRLQCTSVKWKTGFACKRVYDIR